jgi:hypothetical protein
MQRRDLLLAAAAGPLPAVAAPVLRRAIPPSGELLPAVGLGTWLTFHVSPAHAPSMAQRRGVLERFFADGGRLVTDVRTGRSRAR